MTGHTLPGDDDVRAAADALLTEHREGGAYPSVSALAKTFNVNRTTFYRHYAAITNAMLDSAAQRHTDGPKRRHPRHTTTIATKPSGASAPKTPTYEGISTSTKRTSGCSPSTTQPTETNSSDWPASPISSSHGPLSAQQDRCPSPRTEPKSPQHCRNICLHTPPETRVPDTDGPGGGKTSRTMNRSKYAT